MVNDLLPFLGFVERHPVGSSVSAIVESYSSHGAYVTLGEARGYVPLRLMAEPAPRSAREVMKMGDEVELVVVSFNATRRSIDLCVPGMEPAEVKALAAAPAPAPAKRSRKKAAAAVSAPVLDEAAAEAVAEHRTGRPAPAKRTRKKAATTPAAATPAPPAAEPAVAEPALPAKRTRKKAAGAGRAQVEVVPPRSRPRPRRRARSGPGQEARQGRHPQEGSRRAVAPSGTDGSEPDRERRRPPPSPRHRRRRRRPRHDEEGRPA